MLSNVKDLIVNVHNWLILKIIGKKYVVVNAQIKGELVGMHQQNKALVGGNKIVGNEQGETIWPIGKTSSIIQNNKFVRSEGEGISFG
jgi:hypothetical protein